MIICENISFYVYKGCNKKSVTHKKRFVVSDTPDTIGYPIDKPVGKPGGKPRGIPVGNPPAYLSEHQIDNFLNRLTYCRLI